MIRSLLAGLALALFVATPMTSAQTHKDGRLGYQLKLPKGFEPIALNPTEHITVAKYQGDKEWGDREYHISEFEIDFLPNSKISEGETRDDFIESIWEAIESRLGYSEVVKEKSVTIDRSKAVEKHIKPQSAKVMLHCTVLDQEDGIFVFRGMVLEQRFKKYEGDFSKAVKSFKRIEKEDTSDRDAELAQMDDQERFLQTQIDKLPAGWDWHRTDRYLFLFNADKNFVKDLGKQIEAIRDVYEQLYPPDRPIEAVSIVRVCDSRDTYMGYGGPEGTGGYWNSAHKELVIFDKPPRTETEAVLNHEAFHQYIYYYYGQLSPASWYNEGHGDYFAGAKMTKTYRITEFGDAPGGFGRRETVKEGCRELQAGQRSDLTATPLRELLAYSQQEYYARGDIHYPQGWALVHMLRESKRLEPKWKRILDDYLINLVQARHDIAQELMERELEQAEKKEKGSSEDMSRNPEDYYTAASESRTGDIQDRAYETTFTDWSRADWDEFNEFYLEYVEKL